MPPSKTTTRSRVAARKSRIPTDRSATLTHLWQGWSCGRSAAWVPHLLDQIGRDSCMVMSVPRIDLHQHLWPDGAGPRARRARRAAAPPPRRGRLDARAAGRAAVPRGAGRPRSRRPRARGRARRDRRGRRSRCRSRSGSSCCRPPRRSRCWTPSTTAWPSSAAPFRFWAATALTAPGAGTLEIDGLLDRGALGATVPAGALASEVGLVRLSALLDRLQARDVPLFVHPGPAPAGASRRTARGGRR